MLSTAAFLGGSLLAVVLLLYFFQPQYLVVGLIGGGIGGLYFGVYRVLPARMALATRGEARHFVLDLQRMIVKIGYRQSDAPVQPGHLHFCDNAPRWASWDEQNLAVSIGEREIWLAGPVAALEMLRARLLKQEEESHARRPPVRRRQAAADSADGGRRVRPCHHGSRIDLWPMRGALPPVRCAHQLQDAGRRRKTSSTCRFRWLAGAATSAHRPGEAGFRSVRPRSAISRAKERDHVQTVLTRQEESVGVAEAFAADSVRLASLQPIRSVLAAARWTSPRVGGFAIPQAQ